MGKEFIEYHSKTGRISCSASTICNCLTQYARNYISSKREIIANIDKNVRDAVLVDAMNYLYHFCTTDISLYAIYTQDLYSERIKGEIVDAQLLLTVVQNFYAPYIFQNGIVKSVLRHQETTDCRHEFDENDGALVLIDFINYLAEENGYDRKFTIKDLYEKFKIKEYKAEMNRLKDFLEKTSKYSEKLANGESIESIFVNMAREHNLRGISKNEIYYCMDETGNTFQMSDSAKREIEEEIYAMTYAYGKKFGDIEKPSQMEIINIKIFEMKKR